MKKSFLVLTALAIGLLGRASITESTTMNDTHNGQTATQPHSQQMTSDATDLTTPPEDKPGKHGDTVTTASGLKYIDLKKGKGAMPKKGQTITVNYTGKLTNGKTFDSNVDPDFKHVTPF